MGRTSSNILVFGLTITLLAVVGLGLTLVSDKRENKQSLYLVGECPLDNVYFRSSDLTYRERRQFSSDASAFDVIGTSQNKYRLIVDYSLETSTRKNLQLKALLTPKTDVGFSQMNILVNAVEVDSVEADKQDNGPVYLSTKIPLDSNDNNLGIELRSEKGCEFRTNSLLKLEQARGVSDEGGEGFDSAVLSNYQTEEIILSPGDNYVGFEDWSYLPDLFKHNLKIYKFSLISQAWEKTGKYDYVAEPNRAYLISNPNIKNLTIDLPRPYRVPNDINQISLAKKWNMISVDDAQNNLSDLQVNINQKPTELISQTTYKIGNLVQKELIRKIFILNDDGDFEQIDLGKINEQPSSGIFWIYLENEPESDLKIPNLVFDVQGLGDSFESNQIPIKISVENKDDSPHYLVASGINDPCQLGLRVKNDQGKIIFDDFSNKVCPLWPTLEKLSENDKKEYNYLWEAPRDLKGEFILEFYLNYSRLGTPQLVKSSNVTIK
ncbi:MAG: hypothetical protein ABH810_04155 [bacterium]